MNSIVIEKVIVIANHIECTFTICGEWKKYFITEEAFFAEYSKKIDEVPKSVAVIPFLCNILPLVWIFDAEVILDDLDKDFYESIEVFKQGYVQMYPGISFKGRVTPKQLTDNIQDNLDQAATLFSGGVDAYNTLISHIDENPVLVTLWGADITFEDQVGWKLVDNHISSIADKNKLDYVSIKTSFRRFLNEGALSDYVFQITGDNWWYGFQHGIGIIGHMAPFAYQYKIKTTYIASSLTNDDKTTCASDPSIDNYIKYCGSQVIHDGYEYSRPEKVHRISEYVKRTENPIQLRVCWESEGGSNCCHCEKCYRTILCLLAVKSDSRKYGFNYTDDEFADMMKDFRMKIHFLHESYLVVYKNIQNIMRKNYNINQVNQNLKWFYKADLDKVLSIQNRSIYRLLRKGKKIYQKLNIPKR
ncbi:MAG: hypothetical protein K0S01_2837 [Herbinix sp.]|jgi:hypothetical protein|nr:hypothetical protein [Herbinix sp.]